MALGLTRRGRAGAGRLRCEQVGHAFLVHAGGEESGALIAFASRAAQDPGRTVVVLDLAQGAPAGVLEDVAEELADAPGRLRLIPARTAQLTTLPAGAWLAERIGRTVLAHDGRARVVAGGGMYIPPGAGRGWMRLDPGRAPVPHSRRFPSPDWECAPLAEPRRLDRDTVVEPLPSGVWVRTAREGSGVGTYRRWLHENVLPNPIRPEIVLGHPGSAATAASNLARWWSEVPAEVRRIARFAQLGEGAAASGSVGQSLADAFGEPVALAGSVGLLLPTEGGGAERRALTPAGVVRQTSYAEAFEFRPRSAGADRPADPAPVDVRAPIPGLRQQRPGVFEYGDGAAILEVVQGGLWVRPADAVRSTVVRRLAPTAGEPRVFYTDDTWRHAETMRAIAVEVLARLDPEMGAAAELTPVSRAVAVAAAVVTEPVTAAVSPPASGPTIARLPAPGVSVDAYATEAVRGLSAALVGAPRPDAAPAPALDVAPAATETATAAAEPAVAIQVAVGEGRETPAAPPPPSVPTRVEVGADRKAAAETRTPHADGTPLAWAELEPVWVPEPERDLTPLLEPNRDPGPLGPASEVREDGRARTSFEDADGARRPVPPAGAEALRLAPPPALRLMSISDETPSLPAPLPVAAASAATPLPVGSAEPAAPASTAELPSATTATSALSTAEPPRVQPVPPPAAAVGAMDADLAKERQWVRRNLASEFDAAASWVSRVLSEYPGLRAGGNDQAAITDLVAARLYLSGRTRALDDAVRLARPGPHVPLARCVNAGLGRLPSYRGAACMRVDLDDAEWNWYQEGATFTEWSFAPMTAGLEFDLPGGVDVLVWCMTARRTPLVHPDPPHQVILLPGTRFTVLAAHEAVAGGRPALWLRELTPAEAAEPEHGGPHPDPEFNAMAAKVLEQAQEAWRAADPDRPLPSALADRYASPPGLIARNVPGPVGPRPGPAVDSEQEAEA